MAPERDPHVLLGLIGAPIRHSASPAMHEAAAAAVGLRAHYQLVEIAGADHAMLRTLLEGVRRLGFAGVNVTFPYKEAVLAHLDGLSDDARAVEAVNTVLVQDGRLIGHNTDTSGFARALSERFGPRPAGPFAVIGAGGVGKAIAVALAGLSDDEIRIVDTDAGKAEALVARLAGRAAIRLCGSVAEAVDGAGGVINATPIGMSPNRDTPVPFDRLRGGMWVADAVYSPLWTPLLEAARRIGAPVMSGRDLAIRQALDAFRLFTGREAPASTMEKAFDAVTTSRDARSRA